MAIGGEALEVNDQVQSLDVVIVGAGAAGLAAAIFAAERAAGRLRVVVLEGAEKIGAKILISGGGRCNVTHERVSADDFNGSRNVVRRVIAAFDERAAREWFTSLGVALKREATGKLFPVNDRAGSVVSALTQRCRALGVELRVGARVAAITRVEGDQFQLVGDRLDVRARRVILATGGRSLPRTGSDGSGWRLAEALGHSVTETFPALVPLVLAPAFFHAQLSGISHDVELSTFADNKLVDRRRGSLLFTHFGVSGPVVLDASRHWVAAQQQGRATRLGCCFLPGESFESIDAKCVAAARQRPRQLTRRWLAGLFTERLADELARAAECAEIAMGQLSREQRRRLVHLLNDLELPVMRARGWDFAEVTAGGVPLAEVDPRTMESRRQPGLYLIGEMLDCDGRIGGFNFQWAWSTGYLAGQAAGAAVTHD